MKTASSSLDINVLDTLTRWDVNKAGIKLGAKVVLDKSDPVIDRTSGKVLARQGDIGYIAELQYTDNTHNVLDVVGVEFGDDFFAQVVLFPLWYFKNGLLTVLTPVDNNMLRVGTKVVLDGSNWIKDEKTGTILVERGCRGVITDLKHYYPYIDRDGYRRLVEVTEVQFNTDNGICKVWCPVSYYERNVLLIVDSIDSVEDVDNTSIPDMDGFVFKRLNVYYREIDVIGRGIVGIYSVSEKIEPGTVYDLLEVDRDGIRFLTAVVNKIFDCELVLIKLVEAAYTVKKKLYAGSIDMGGQKSCGVGQPDFVKVVGKIV